MRPAARPRVRAPFRVSAVATSAPERVAKFCHPATAIIATCVGCRCAGRVRPPPSPAGVPLDYRASWCAPFVPALAAPAARGPLRGP
eukprot:2314797-Prymnesium_polylepis.1